MDIVRKKPTPVSAAKERHEEDRVRISIEKKHEPTPAVSHEAPVREHVVAWHPNTDEEIEEAHTSKEETVHPEPRIMETHLPDVSSMEMDDRPIAYIPKEKPSREERKILERIERRERSSYGKERQTGSRRGIAVWIVVPLLLGLAAYLAIAVLPRAEIVLVPKKVSWTYNNMIGGNTKVAEIDPANRQIPVAVFSEKKTNAFKFPATGSGKGIERKATGKVTIYNEFGASAQPLLAGTRLQTPDGKIFRLKDRIVVPAAKTSAGELVPSGIEADVIADKAGESYNIGPVGRFTIPGFQGTSKFEKFYAESKDSMTGGFIGEGKYPTAEDIRMAKESAERQMKGVIESFLATQVVPEGFKTIESSRKFTISKEMVNETVDDQGNFSVYMEAEGSVDALKEEHVLKLMTALARQANNDESYQIKESTLSYGNMSIDEKTGAIALPVDFKGVFWKPIDANDFREKVAGRAEDELKSFIFNSTNIEKADVSLWPFWVKAVPNDTERIKVEVK